MPEAVTEAPQIFNLAWLIIVLPVIGLLINTFGGKDRSEGEIGWTAVIAAGGAFFVSLLVVIALLGMPEEARALNHGVDVPLFTFFQLGPSKVEMGLHIDTLTGVMLMVVTFVGIADPHLRHRLHARRQPLPTLLHLPQPVHGFHADPGAGE